MESDTNLVAWWTIPLGEMTRLFLGAHYEKVLVDGTVRATVVRSIAGGGPDGRPSVNEEYPTEVHSERSLTPDTPPDCGPAR